MKRIISALLVLLATFLPAIAFAEAQEAGLTISFPREAELEILPMANLVLFGGSDPSKSIPNQNRAIGALSYVIKVRIGGEVYYSYAGLGHGIQGVPALAVGALLSSTDAGLTQAGGVNPRLYSHPGKEWGVNLATSSYGSFGFLCKSDLPDGEWLKVGRPRRGEAVLLTPHGEMGVKIVSVRRNGWRLDGYKRKTVSIKFTLLDGNSALSLGNSGAILIKDGEVIGVLAGSDGSTFYAVHIEDMLSSHQESLERSLKTLCELRYSPPPHDSRAMEPLTTILRTARN